MYLAVHTMLCGKTPEFEEVIKQLLPLQQQQQLQINLFGAGN